MDKFSDLCDINPIFDRVILSSICAGDPEFLNQIWHVHWLMSEL